MNDLFNALNNSVLNGVLLNEDLLLNHSEQQSEPTWKKIYQDSLSSFSDRIDRLLIKSPKHSKECAKLLVMLDKFQKLALQASNEESHLNSADLWIAALEVQRNGIGCCTRLFGACASKEVNKILDKCINELEINMVLKKDAVVRAACR